MNKKQMDAASPQVVERDAVTAPAPPRPAAVARTPGDAAAQAPNFLRAIVADDMRSGKYGGRVVTPRKEPGVGQATIGCCIES